MGVSANSGPYTAFGQMGGDNNSQRSPSMFDMGVGLLDPRSSYAYSGRGGVYGFGLMSVIPVIDAVPSAIAAANIAAAQAATAGTALTLVSTSGAGVTVGASVLSGGGAQAPTALAIDGAAGVIGFGTAVGSAIPSRRMWNPATFLSRNVRITSVGNDSAGAFLVKGYDLYGVPMSESIAGANAGVASGKKAFKYIASVTPTGTVSGSNVSVGTGDVYGFPLRVDSLPYVTIWWNGAQITSSTGLLPAVTTSPATSTTGDVRGTYAVQSASDGTKSLQVFITPKLANIAPVANAFPGLFGVQQA